MMQRGLRGGTHHKEMPLRTKGLSAKYFLKIKNFPANYCFQESFLKNKISLTNETPGLL